MILGFVLFQSSPAAWVGGVVVWGWVLIEAALSLTFFRKKFLATPLTRSQSEYFLYQTQDPEPRIWLHAGFLGRPAVLMSEGWIRESLPGELEGVWRSVAEAADFSKVWMQVRLEQIQGRLGLTKLEERAHSPLAILCLCIVHAWFSGLQRIALGRYESPYVYARTQT
jgi:hypothetical protein